MLVNDDDAVGAPSEGALRRQDAHCRGATDYALNCRVPEAVELLDAAKAALIRAPWYGSAMRSRRIRDPLHRWHINRPSTSSSLHPQASHMPNCKQALLVPGMHASAAGQVPRLISPTLVSCCERSCMHVATPH